MAVKDDLILRISNGLFKSSLMKTSPKVFAKPIEKFEINKNEKWVIWGPGKSKFIDILSLKYVSEPPAALHFNFKKQPIIEQVKFQGSLPAAHLSARFEFYKDEFDQTCRDFILDNSIGSSRVHYAVKTTSREVDRDLYHRLIKELQLSELEDRWAMGLSNGQMRRARLAKALLKKPDLLLIDDPFLGLDPSACSIISKFLANSERNINVPVIIGLRYQDEIPQWCTHIAHVDDHEGLQFSGKIDYLRKQIDQLKEEENAKLFKEKEERELSNRLTPYDLISMHSMCGRSYHEIIKMPHCIEFKGINITYRGSPVLKDLEWQVRPGSKWHIRGDNGTGKSTLLSLILAEHPQSWNSKVVEDGHERRTGSSNYFDINKNIGMSSPELHAVFIKDCGSKLNVRECIASGFHEGSSNNFTKMWDKLNTEQKRVVEMYLEFFGLQQFADTQLFGELTISEQKLVLFVRSLVKMPKILILDEAFSGMEIEPMLKCHDFLEYWPGTVLVVAHVDQETPKCDHYLRLLGPGKYTVGDVNN
ncbi:hypothetical protein KAFR_0C02740 [Kazachstania africana CBS 2517]|uniref:ABC transporter domain-containing protein n=1 Tax=Kazachstania africana (strain ATCC 22294 / BCRC 22015 / CBS 2517 / CECT 1963 / NBRC 1671 / NRRL Y-8276) TaxID=1071382 RepID=H2ASB7_KAZAF|nr:hypothetical protein KAFR_0C02740 [Kazachstania africana CBS 2517]CCF57267.1 hypothetical protein KAFR_0C02740 [Kazachstania africana CBS 2517]